MFDLDPSSAGRIPPAGTPEAQPTATATPGRQLDVGDLAHDPGVGNVGDRPWVRTRMSNGDMFALGFYGGLGFLTASAIVGVALAVVIALALAVGRS